MFAKAIIYPVWSLNLELVFFSFFTMKISIPVPEAASEECLKEGSQESARELTSELPLCCHSPLSKFVLN